MALIECTLLEDEGVILINTTNIVSVRRVGDTTWITTTATGHGGPYMLAVQESPSEIAEQFNEAENELLFTEL